MTDYWVDQTNPEYLHTDPKCPKIGRYKRWASAWERENLIECQQCARAVVGP